MTAAAMALGLAAVCEATAAKPIHFDNKLSCFMQHLALFEYRHSLPWIDVFGSTLQSLGYRVIRRALNRALVWNPKEAATLGAQLCLADGFELSKVWIGRKGIFLAISPRRLYFENAAAEAPLRESENELFGPGQRPLPLDAQELVRRSLQLKDLLAEKCPNFSALPISCDSVIEGAHQESVRVFGQNTAVPVGTDVWRSLMRFGMRRVPAGFGVRLFYSSEQERYFCERLRGHLLEWMREAHLGDDIGVSNIISLTRRLNAVENGAILKRDESKAILLVTGSKTGQPVEPHLGELLVKLDRIDVRYRLVSTQNTNLKWPSRSLLIALILLAGGIPFALRLPCGGRNDDIAFLGVDLGHPDRKRHGKQSKSWLAVSLVDRDGSHVWTWRSLQEARDETAGAALLAELLCHVERRLDALLGYRPGGIVVYRDGRLHAGERVDIYKSALKRPLTFVEVSKRGNPFLYRNGGRVDVVEAGAAALLPQSNIGFLTPVVNKRKGLPSTLKIRILEDEPDLGLAQVVKLTAGLCYAPSLGFDPHALPAPIYWADGIASVNAFDLQFAGLRFSNFR